MGEGEGGKIWENGIEACVMSCMRRVASPGSMYNAGCLGLAKAMLNLPLKIKGPHMFFFFKWLFLQCSKLNEPFHCKLIS